MSFSIKSSHVFLTPNPQVIRSDTKRSLDDLLKLDDEEEEKKMGYKPKPSTVMTKLNIVQNGSAKINANSGLVIRSNYRAQEDFY